METADDILFNVFLLNFSVSTKYFWYVGVRQVLFLIFTQLCSFSTINRSKIKFCIVLDLNLSCSKKAVASLIRFKSIRGRGKGRSKEKSGKTTKQAKTCWDRLNRENPKVAVLIYKWQHKVGKDI